MGKLTSLIFTHGGKSDFIFILIRLGTANHLIRRKVVPFQRRLWRIIPDYRFEVVELDAVLAQEEWRNHSDNMPLYSGV